MSSNKYGDKSIEFDIIEEGKKVIKEGYLPIHADFMTGKLNVAPKVWLTVEEVKKISDALDWVDGYMYCSVYKKDIEAFKKQIEQAEKGNETK